MANKADGSVVIKAEIELDKAEKDLDKLKKDLYKTEKEVESLKEKKASASASGVLKKVELEAEVKKLDELKKKLIEVKTVSKDIAFSEGARAQAKLDLPYAQADVSNQAEKVRELKKEYAKINSEVASYDKKIEHVTQKLERQTDEAGEMVKRVNELDRKIKSVGAASRVMAGAQEYAGKSVRRFGLRLREVIRSALVFTLITQTLSKFREWFGKVLKTNDKAQQSFAKLKGALLTLAQPLVEVIVPALVALSDILTQVAYFFVYLFAALQGKTAQEAADAVKALNEEVGAIDGVGTAAKNATKALAGFDEINTLNTSDKSDNVVTPDFSGISELPTWMKELAEGIAIKIRDIRFSWDEAGLPDMEDSWETALIGLLGAVIGGKFFGITGSLIGLSMGLLISLISGQFEALENFDWNGDESDVLGMSALLGGILGGMFLGLNGAMIGIALGIAVSLTGMTFDSENFNANEAKAYLRVALAAVIGIAMGRLLGFGLLGSVIGLMLGLSIGLADVAFGEEFDASTRAAARKELLVVVSAMIGALIGAVFGGGVFGGIVGGVIGLTFGVSVNLILDSFDTSAIKNAKGPLDLIGALWSGGTYSLRSADIPQLATGAVIPPNREFLAVLGDQRSGNNIEAPESLIRKIVREEAGGMNTQLLHEILQAIKDGGVIVLDGQKVSKRVVHHINNMTAAAGESVLLL